MTTATLRISTPASVPAAKRDVTTKGFFARALDSLIKARQREVEQKLAQYARDGRLPPRFYL